MDQQQQQQQYMSEMAGSYYPGGDGTDQSNQQQFYPGDTSGKDQQQSLGVYTPDSSTNSVHSLHSYNPGQAGTGTPTAGDTGDYHTVQASVAAVSKPGSSVGDEYHAGDGSETAP